LGDIQARPPLADELLALANLECLRARVGIGQACKTSDKRDLCATCRRNLALREAAGEITRTQAENDAYRRRLDRKPEAMDGYTFQQCLDGLEAAMVAPHGWVTPLLRKLLTAGRHVGAERDRYRAAIEAARDEFAEHEGASFVEYRDVLARLWAVLGPSPTEQETKP
jgi:hypothetical protein